MVNPYDWCISISTIDGKQFTISWYVYGKLSQLNEHMNTRIIEGITEYFGELTVSRGKSNKLMGMAI